MTSALSWTCAGFLSRVRRSDYYVRLPNIELRVAGLTLRSGSLIFPSDAPSYPDHDPDPVVVVCLGRPIPNDSMILLRSAPARST